MNVGNGAGTSPGERPEPPGTRAAPAPGARLEPRGVRAALAAERTATLAQVAGLER
jgi:hypothetical protein